MKVANVYVLTPPAPAREAVAAEPAVKASSLYAGLAPLGSIRSDGTYGSAIGTLGLKALAGLDLSKFPSFHLPQTPAAASSPAVPLPNAGSVENNGVMGKLMGGASVAVGGVSSGYSFIHITQGATQAQVFDALRQVSVPQQHANGFASALMQIIHSHLGHAVCVAIPTGVMAGALANYFGLKKYTLAIGCVATIFVLALFYFLIKENNPFEGRWNMDPIQTTYQQGTPPRQAVEEIKERSGGLLLSRVAIEEGGKRENLTEHLLPDGRPHPAAVPGEVVVTTQNGNVLESVYTRNGQTVETDTRVLSADQKSMIVTALHVTPSGEKVQDVTVYERQ